MVDEAGVDTDALGKSSCKVQAKKWIKSFDEKMALIRSNSA